MEGNNYFNRKTKNHESLFDREYKEMWIFVYLFIDTSFICFLRHSFSFSFFFFGMGIFNFFNSWCRRVKTLISYSMTKDLLVMLIRIHKDALWIFFFFFFFFFFLMENLSYFSIINNANKSIHILKWEDKYIYI